MKKLLFISTGFFMFCIIVLSSCNKDDCDGLGTLEAKNTSQSTVQRLLINGISYGTLDPNEVKPISLNVGQYEVVFEAVTEGSGCSPATVNIVECQTFNLSCSGK